MNILVTGSEGFIGNAMVGKLKNKSNLIVGLDQKKNHKHKVSHSPDVFIIGDVRNYNLMMQIIADYEIDEIYHFASKAIVGTCVKDPYGTYDNNISGTVSLLEACRNSGQRVKNIIVSTSDKAFGESPVPYVENSPVRPLYSYDTSKACQQLISISYAKNYGLPVKVVACGNVYGPGDNNFSRLIPKTITNLNNGKKAVLYSGSETHIREWVYIDDAVEAFYTVCKKGNNGEIYCCGDTKHIRTGDLIRKICEAMGKDPSVNVETVIKDIHFKEIKEQYLDATKLRALGWGHKIGLDEGLKKCIEYYTNRKPSFLNERDEIIIKGDTALIDKRGKIDNYILNEPINWIGLITTENVDGDKYMIRANHYHPIQEQKVLVISGKYISVYRDLNNPNATIKHHLVEAGDLVVTPPNVVHAQIFLENTVLLNLVHGEREKENYGSHTIPYELLKSEDLQKYVNIYTNKTKINDGCFLLEKCRICGSRNLKSVISFGDIPLPNRLLSAEDLNKQEKLYPLELMYCEQCHLCQLSHFISPEEIFGDYDFVSSTTFMNREHFRVMAESIIENYKLNNNSLVVDIGSNDGLFLKYFKNRGINVCGVDPAEKACRIANENGIETICDFFNDNIVKEIVRERGKAHVVSANNVFAHLHDIGGFIKNVKEIISNDGVFVMEAQYILDTIKGNTFDNIYHEHHSYYSVLALNEFFKRNDMKIIKVEHLDVHGGSIRVFAQKIDGNKLVDGSVKRFLEEELSFGLDNFSTYEKFAKDIYQKKESIRKLILGLKSEGKKIVGYGAPAKAVTSLNFYGIDNKYIDYVIEDNPLKIGKIIPGVRIPIVKRDSLNEALPDYVYILAWNYAKEIMANNSFYKDRGVKFIIPKKEIEIL